MNKITSISIDERKNLGSMLNIVTLEVEVFANHVEIEMSDFNNTGGVHIKLDADQVKKIAELLRRFE